MHARLTWFLGLSIPALGVLFVGAACPPRVSEAAPPVLTSPTPQPPVVATQSSERFAPVPAGKRLVILWTASVRGWVSPCGCTEDPLGGVARYAAAVEEARAAYGERVLLLDVGDAFFERVDDNAPADACQAEARQRVLVETWSRAGVLATTVGPYDEARGSAWRKGMWAGSKIATLPSVTTELRTPWRVFDRGGIRVAVMALRVDDKEEVSKARVSLERAIRGARAQKPDVVVLLGQAPRALLVSVVRGLQGLDVVLQGRQPGEEPRSPESLGGPVLLAAGERGQHLGVAALDLEGHVGGTPLKLDDREAERAARTRVLDARLAEYTKQLAALDEGPRRAFIATRLAAVEEERAALSTTEAPPLTGPHLRFRALALRRGDPEEPIAAAALRAYETSIPTLVARCEENLTCPEPPPGAPVYVGVQACFACHQAAFQTWQKAIVDGTGKDEAGATVARRLGHAKAWETLRAGNRDRDRDCVGCHSTGFGQPGGFCRTVDVDFRTDVQCEACHGPGSAHIAAGGDKALIQRDVTEATCRGCHHPPHIPNEASFVFAEKLLHILGPGHGEVRRRALEAAQ